MTDQYAHEAQRRMAALPYYGSPDLRPVQLAEVYAQLTATSVARAAFLGELLAQAYAEHGIEALVGHKLDGAVLSGGKDYPAVLETYPVSEEIRALVALEGAERDRAERLTREAIKLGIEAKKVDVMRAYGRTVAEVTRSFTQELGLSWQDPAIRRAAQRAVLAARRNLGFDGRSPDEVGPRLAPAERDRVLDRGVTPLDETEGSSE